MKSIINHYCWSVTSTEIGNEGLIEAKLTSLTQHIQNIHHGHKAPYPKCSHLPLEKSVQRSTKWIKPDTEAADKLQAIIEKKTLVKDIRKSSPHAQTSVVEGYHSLLNHFAPKMYHFHFHGMESYVLQHYTLMRIVSGNNIKTSKVNPSIQLLYES